MTEDAFVEYLSRLWSMLMWGNKRFLANKLIADNGFDMLKKQLAELLYGSIPVEKRVCTGTILRGILSGELSNVPWPLIESRVQRDLVSKVQSIFALRAESKRLLEKAKTMVETAIEQGEEATMKSVESL